MNWVALATGYAAVVCFACAMAVHHRTVFGRMPARGRSRLLRAGGAFLLLVTLAAAVRSLGVQVGLVAVTALVSVAGFVVTQLLAYAPRLLLGVLGPLFLCALLAVLHQ